MLTSRVSIVLASKLISSRSSCKGRQRIGVGRNHPGGDAFGIMGIHVQHEEKLAEKLRAVAVGEAMINPAPAPAFQRDRW
jgi:hypothetical protein